MGKVGIFSFLCSNVWRGLSSFCFYLFLLFHHSESKWREERRYQKVREWRYFSLSLPLMCDVVLTPLFSSFCFSIILKVSGKEETKKNGVWWNEEAFISFSLPLTCDVAWVPPLSFPLFHIIRKARREREQGTPWNLKNSTLLLLRNMNWGKGVHILTPWGRVIMPFLLNSCSARHVWTELVAFMLKKLLESATKDLVTTSVPVVIIPHLSGFLL